MMKTVGNTTDPSDDQFCCLLDIGALQHKLSAPRPTGERTAQLDSC
jgi:hypothetical protein